MPDIFYLGEKKYGVPDSLVTDFISKNPDAVRGIDYTLEGKNYNIPENLQQSFLEKNPSAQEIAEEAPLEQQTSNITYDDEGLNQMNQEINSRVDSYFKLPTRVPEQPTPEPTPETTIEPTPEPNIELPPPDQSFIEKMKPSINNWNKQVGDFNNAFYQSIDNIVSARTTTAEAWEPLTEFFNRSRDEDEEVTGKELVVNIAEGATKLIGLPVQLARDVTEHPLEFLEFLAIENPKMIGELMQGASLDPILQTRIAMGDEEAIAYKKEVRQKIARYPVEFFMQPFIFKGTIKQATGVTMKPKAVISKKGEPKFKMRVTKETIPIIDKGAQLLGYLKSKKIYDKVEGIYYRKVKKGETGLVPLNEMIEPMIEQHIKANPKLSEAELARAFPDYFEKSLEKRVEGEVPVKETVAGRKVVFDPPIEVPAPPEAPVKPTKPPVKPVEVKPEKVEDITIPKDEKVPVVDKTITEIDIKKIKDCPPGQCYRNAVQAAKENQDIGAKVVQGKVRLSQNLAGKPTTEIGGHSWVEIGDKVYDPTIDAIMSKDKFYELAEAVVVNELSPIEAMSLSLKYKYREFTPEQIKTVREVQVEKPVEAEIEPEVSKIIEEFKDRSVVELIKEKKIDTYSDYTTLRDAFEMGEVKEGDIIAIGQRPQIVSIKDDKIKLKTLWGIRDEYDMTLPPPRKLIYVEDKYIPDRVEKYGDVLPDKGEIEVVHQSPMGAIEKFDKKKIGEGWQVEDPNQLFQGAWFHEDLAVLTETLKAQQAGYGEAHKYNINWDKPIAWTDAIKLIEKHLAKEKLPEDYIHTMPRSQASKIIEDAGYDMIYTPQSDGTMEYTMLNLAKIKLLKPKPVEAPVEKPVTAVEKEQTAKLNKQYNEILQAQAAAQSVLLREDLPGGKLASYEQSFERSTALLEDLELEAKTKGITLEKKPTETDAIVEAVDILQKIDPEVEYQVKLDELRTAQDAIDDPADPATAGHILASIQEAGAELAGVEPVDIKIAGQNYQESRDGTLVDIIKLHSGADLGTVAHERIEMWYRQQEQIIDGWDNKITEVRSKYHEQTGEKDDPSQSNREWFSDRGVDNALGAEPTGKIPAALQRIFRKFREYFEHLRKSADRFAKYVREGKVSKELKSFLDRSVAERIKTPKEVAKAVKKKKPTYKLKEITGKEAFELHKTAKKIFGVTKDPREAGYILNDGSMLDFSGKIEGGTPGVRAYDHREINRVGYAEEGGLDKFDDIGMLEFVQSGAIRYMPESFTFHLGSQHPDQGQLSTMRKLIEDGSGMDAVWADYDTPITIRIDKSGFNEKGDPFDSNLNIFEKNYDRDTSWEVIKRDILQYIKTGREPSIVQQFRTTYQLKKKKPLIKELSITTEKVQAKKPNSVLKADVAIYLNNRSLQIQKKHGVDLRPVKLESGRWAEDTPEVRDIISDIIVDEIALELKRLDAGQFTAKGWYTEKIVNEMKEMEKVLPEIKDPLQRDLFKAVMAITSNNQAVKLNLKYATGEYRKYLENGKFDENFKGGGKAQQSMQNHFSYLNMLIERHGLPATMEFLTSKYKANELAVIGKEEIKPTFSLAELADTDVYGAIIFGSKVGNGFFPNLLGDHNALTQDMWFMRTIGRIRGNLVERNYGTNLKKFRQNLLDRGAGKYHQYGLKRKDVIEENEEKLIRAADDIKKETQRKKYVGETQLEKDAKTLIKNYIDVRDAPTTGMERFNNRAIMEEVSKKTGYAVDDSQAIIWFPEKRLYRKLGVRNPEALETDYEIEAKRLVNSEQKRYGGRGVPVIRPSEGVKLRGKSVEAKEKQEKAQVPTYQLKKLYEDLKSGKTADLSAAELEAEAIRLKTGKKPPIYAGSINLDKLVLDDAMKSFELAMGKLTPKKTVTWDETGKISAEILSDYKKAIKVLKKGKKQGILKAAEIDALRQIAVNGIYRLKEMAESGNDAAAVRAVENYYVDIFKLLNDVTSEVGRALNIFKRTVSERRMARAFSELTRNMNEREIAEFKDLNMENPLEVERFIKRLGDPLLMDYVYEFWYNSILSGIPTHIVNIASNTLWGLYQVPFRALSGGLDALITKFTGKQRERYVSEILPMLSGFGSGWKIGRKRAGKVITTGQTPIELDTKWDLDMGGSVGAFERSPYLVLRKVAPAMSGVGRALRAMDVWFNSMAFDAQLNALAKRMVKKKGLKGKEAKDRELELKKKPTTGMINDAKDFAKLATFMDKPDSVTNWLIKGRSKIWGGRFIVPFVNTLANIFKRGWEITPAMGLVRNREYFKGTNEGYKNSVSDIIAKQMIGAIIAAIILAEYSEDRFTGAVPKNKTEREQFYDLGKLPWAIRFGDTWVSYRRIEPFNTVLATATIVAEQMKKFKENEIEEVSELFFALADGIYNNLLDSSMLKGLSDLMDRNSKRRNFFKRWAGTFVPYSSFWRSINRSIEVHMEGDAKVREVKALSDAFSQNLPFGTLKLKPRMNVWGEDITLEGGVLRQWLPFKWRTETKDPVDKELERIGLYPSIPDKKVTIRGEKVDIPDQMYEEYRLTLGKKLHDLLSINLRPDLEPERASMIYKTIIDRIKIAHLKIMKAKLIKEINSGKYGYTIGYFNE